MRLITLKITARELELLTTLASDQLFRREFIDPRMPGYKSNTAEVSLGKALVARLRSIQDPGRAKRTPPARTAGKNGGAMLQPSFNSSGKKAPDAL
ncbi:MAG: hypothetical protein HY235_01685 [Acidobacteria bacterium]|nr:hypothetical protein [Acidobacteriota bacterium]